jgi:hypothetical protein
MPSKSYATLGLNNYANLKEQKTNTTGSHTNTPPPGGGGAIWCKRNYSILPFSFILVYILFSIIYSSFHCNCNDLKFISFI